MLAHQAPPAHGMRVTLRIPTRNSRSDKHDSISDPNYHGFDTLRTSFTNVQTFLSSYYSVYDFSCYKNKGPCTVSLGAKAQS